MYTKKLPSKRLFTDRKELDAKFLHYRTFQLWQKRKTQDNSKSESASLKIPVSMNNVIELLPTSSVIPNIPTKEVVTSENYSLLEKSVKYTRRTTMIQQG